jgi:hypothetical protein
MLATHTSIPPPARSRACRVASAVGVGGYTLRECDATAANLRASGPTMAVRRQACGYKLQCLEQLAMPGTAQIAAETLQAGVGSWSRPAEARSRARSASPGHLLRLVAMSSTSTRSISHAVGLTRLKAQAATSGTCASRYSSGAQTVRPRRITQRAWIAEGRSSPATHRDLKVLPARRSMSRSDAEPWRPWPCRGCSSHRDPLACLAPP